MTILHQQGYATTNLCPRYGLASERIQYMYQCTHKEIRGRWIASVDALRKWLKARNTNLDIAIILVNTLLYITGEINTCHNVQI